MKKEMEERKVKKGNEDGGEEKKRTRACGYLRGGLPLDRLVACSIATVALTITPSNQNSHKVFSDGRDTDRHQGLCMVECWLPIGSSSRIHHSYSWLALSTMKPQFYSSSYSI